MGSRRRDTGIVEPSRSSISTSTPSTRCSTARRASPRSSPPRPPTASRRSASPTTGTCTASSTSTAPRATRTSRRSSAPRPTWSPRAAFDRPRRDEHDIYHLTLLAESTQGYKNLIKVSSHAYLDGFYYKPRVDFELLEQHHEGLVATTGCLGGAVSQRLLKPTTTRARASTSIASSRSSGATRSSSSCRTTGCPSSPGQPAADQARTRPARAAARHQRQPLHAPSRRRVARRAAVRADRLPHSTIPKRFKFDADEFYLKTAAEMRVAVRRLRGGVRQHAAHRRARQRRDRVRQHGAAVVPHSAGPRRETPTSASSHSKGAKERYGASPAPEVLERIEYELGVIKTMGFSAYFLIVWDLVPLRADRAASASDRGEGARRDRASPTACASSTSTRSSTTCCSSASSTRVASRCPTSTWTSTPATAAR